MSVPSAIIPLSTKRKAVKMTIFEKRELAEKLAKEKYTENYLSALWGSAQVLLQEKDLDTIIRVMEK